ncbi:MAG: hypothetical protein CM1200mP39_06170 [Dehalococcoidia bacterium]|nr:MAG: hypothetical protein CM1200mP39_06170 [Dehalococcoidia bacterium]
MAQRCTGSEVSSQLEGLRDFAGFRGGWADYYRWNLDRNGSFEKSDGRYLTDVLADEAVTFIQRHRNEPFFLMVTWNAPHSPLQAPETVTQKYVDAGFELGIAIIYAMIEVMDQGIGKVRQALDSVGIADDTLLMFTSDNGPAFTHRSDQVPDGVSVDGRRFNCGFAGAKASVYEGGIRVPMIARWPNGLPQDLEIDKQIVFTDWLPTLMSLAKINHVGNKPLDGIDMSEILKWGNHNITLHAASGNGMGIHQPGKQTLQSEKVHGNLSGPHWMSVMQLKRIKH